MTADQVIREATSFMGQYGLLDQGWTFKLNRNKTRLGVCKGRHKRIELSIEYASRVEDGIVFNTIKHETAHAIVGVRHLHNHVWRAKAIELGARPTPCTAVNVVIPGKYLGTCPKCKKEFVFHRKLKRWHYCLPCGPVEGKIVVKMVV